jgi:hypothetical protein
MVPLEFEKWNNIPKIIDLTSSHGIIEETRGTNR